MQKINRFLVVAFVQSLLPFIMLAKASEPAYCIQVVQEGFWRHGDYSTVAVLNTKTGQVLPKDTVGIPPNDERFIRRSPDGKHIAFWNEQDDVSNKHFALYISPSNKSQPIKVYETKTTADQLDPIYIYSYKWSPDSHYLTFLKQVGAHIYIAIVNADGIGEQEQTIDDIPDSLLGWSGDSGYVAVIGSKYNKVYVWSIADFKLNTIEEELFSNSQSEGSPIISWLPVGHKLALIINKTIKSLVQQFMLWSPENGIEITETLDFIPLDYHLEWSPNGQVFALIPFSNDVSHIFAVQDKHLIAIPTDKDVRDLVGWSGENWITTLDYNEERAAELVTLNAFTGARKLLDKGSFRDGKVLISPDKKHIAYTITKGSEELTVWSELDGNNKEVMLTNSYSGGLHWSPDGRYIAAETNKRGKKSVSIRTVDGKKSWELNTELDDRYGLWLRPDWVVYLEHTMADDTNDLKIRNLQTNVSIQVNDYSPDKDILIGHQFDWTSISPDEELAAVPTDGGLLLVPLDAQPLRALKVSASLIFREPSLPFSWQHQENYHHNWISTQLAWSPDSAMLAYIELEKRELAVISRTGSELYRSPLKFSDEVLENQYENQELFLNWTECS